MVSQMILLRCCNISVEGEEQGESAPLWEAGANGLCVGCDALQPHLLLPVCQEDSDPLTGGGRHSKLGELLVEDV